MQIRDELSTEAEAIAAVITEAMRLLPQASGTEAAIVARLRADAALALSLVAEEDGQILGHLAVSAARIGAQEGWGLIGPLTVVPARHGQGIGSALMRAALAQMRPRFRGAALVGDPGYYQRFGFAGFAGFHVPGCPPEVVLALPFGPGQPVGELIHHPGFGADQP